MVDKGPAYIGIVLRTGAEKYPWLTYAGYLAKLRRRSLYPITRSWVSVYAVVSCKLITTI